MRGLLYQTMLTFGVRSVHAIPKHNNDCFRWPIHDPGRVKVEMARSAAGPWTTVLANASATDQNADGLVTLVFPSAVSTADHPRWRISILCRRQKNTAGCDPAFSHSWIKEIKFRRAGAAAPLRAETRYRLWYLPYTTTGSATGISIMAHYAPPDTTKASPAWLQANGLTAESLKDGSFRKRLPEAASWSIGAEDTFESFAPMELPASAAEQAAATASSPAGSAALFFPEDRRFQLKMFDQPPAYSGLVNLN